MAPRIKQTVFQAFPELEEEWDYSRNHIDPTVTSAQSSESAWWKCKECYESWESQISYRAIKRKGVCKVCSHKKVVPHVNSLEITHPELIKEWNDQRNISSFCFKSNIKVNWQCSKCNYCWNTAIRNRTINGSNCKLCYLTPSKEKSIESLPKFLLEEVSQSNSQAMLRLLFVPSAVKILWNCSKNFSHSWEASTATRLKGGGNCPYCNDKKFIHGLNSIAEKYSKISNQLASPYDATQIFFKDSLPLPWICLKCGLRELTTAKARAEKDCSNCYSNSRLESKVIAYITQTFPELELSLRKRPLKKIQENGWFEMDIWIPALKLSFEIQDFATHSRSSDEEFGHPWSKSGFKFGPSYHEEKRKIAFSQLGVKIIDIWEDEITDNSYEAIVFEAIINAF